MRRRRAFAAAACLAGFHLSCASAPPRPSSAAPAPVEARAPARSLPTASDLEAAPSHVLLISIAGLSAHHYRSEGGAPARMPNLAMLARSGAAADALVPVAPASPGPAHATLVTGRTPAVHGIGGDHPLGPRGADAARNRHAEAIRVPALWNLSEQAGVSTALIGWPTSVGAPADWLFPELFPARIGEASPALLEGKATAELLAGAQQLGSGRPEAGFPGPARDDILAGLACELLGGASPPRLTLLRFSQTEPVLRRVGPRSAAAAEAFSSVDAALGRILSCLESAGRLRASALIVTGDVPVHSVHTVVQPNVALEQAGLLVPGPGSRTGILRWDALARSNGTSAFVYSRDPETAVLARRALQEAAGQSLAFRVVSAEEMLGLGTDREAWFGLEAQPGYAFGDGLRGGALVIPSAARGAWGGLAGEASPDVGFVAWGSGLRGPRRIPELRQTDVAPTLASLLGLALPESDGRPLVGLLRAPPVALGPPGGSAIAR